MIPVSKLKTYNTTQFFCAQDLLIKNLLLAKYIAFPIIEKPFIARSYTAPIPFIRAIYAICKKCITIFNTDIHLGYFSKLQKASIVMLRATNSATNLEKPNHFGQ